MNFKEWRGSEEVTARNYRWHITSCDFSNQENAEEASKSTFEAGKIEGLKKATRLLANVILPEGE